ncbi:hypothetical protein BJ170DRAFT_639532 [Xylariales sp. AK1849]|nr:hypothetical protein BJ170DRAFT_639532 [Xylariales sp. AK1849]
MVKFVASDSTGLPLKRKQVAHACISCRKRKKRCIHEGALLAEHHGRLQELAAPIGASQHTYPPREAFKLSSGGARPLSSPTGQESRATSRFIGDLNPEHLFIEATSPHSSRDLSVRGGIGVWQSRNAHDAKALPTSVPPHPGPLQSMQNLLVSHVRTQCLPCIPPMSDWLALRVIYFEKLHPLYPVISESLAECHDTPASAAVVKQVICLAAATDPAATPHFRLKPDSTLLSRSEFTASLAAAIHATIESGLLSHRILLIRVLLLFSMYMQPSGPDEADLPTLVFSRAAHQLFTLGFQLPIDEMDPDFEQTQTLFLCTWTLDRLNSAFYGRACIIHERDIGWDFEECIQKQQPPFRLFLLVTRLLENVISLYRPTQKLAEEPLFIDLPILEQLIIDADATEVASPLLATVEVFYHSVAILSCRFPQGTNRSHLPSRATNSRRSLSADRITELIRDEFAGQISYMPTIPYAVSLSLSVMYRKMRWSQVPMFRNRGQRTFAANTTLLKDLGDTFWCAKTMASMAEQVLQQMGRAVASITQETASSESSTREGSTAQPDIHTERPGVATSTIAVDISDVSILESAPQVDVWRHFDPNFDLGAVDAAIQGNLDFGTSSNWFDWQQSWGFVE